MHLTTAADRLRPHRSGRFESRHPASAVPVMDAASPVTSL